MPVGEFESVFDQFSWKVDSVCGLVHTRASLFKDVSTFRIHHFDSGAGEDRQRGFVDAEDIRVVERAVTASFEAGRKGIAFGGGRGTGFASTVSCFHNFDKIVGGGWIVNDESEPAD